MAGNHLLLVLDPAALPTAFVLTMLGLIVLCAIRAIRVRLRKHRRNHVHQSWVSHLEQDQWHAASRMPSAPHRSSRD